MSNLLQFKSQSHILLLNDAHVRVGCLKLVLALFPLRFESVVFLSALLHDFFLLIELLFHHVRCLFYFGLLDFQGADCFFIVGDL